MPRPDQNTGEKGSSPLPDSYPNIVSFADVLGRPLEPASLESGELEPETASAGDASSTPPAGEPESGSEDWPQKG